MKRKDGRWGIPIVYIPETGKNAISPDHKDYNIDTLAINIDMLDEEDITKVIFILNDSLTEVSVEEIKSYLKT